MEGRELITQLIERVAPNATVVEIDEDDERYRVTLAGTTGVTARCELPREAVDSARALRETRRRVALMLKQCADTTIATVPDGRG